MVNELHHESDNICCGDLNVNRMTMTSEYRIVLNGIFWQFKIPLKLYGTLQMKRSHLLINYFQSGENGKIVESMKAA